MASSSTEECGFCREILVYENKVIRVLPCTHKFCHKCLCDNQRIAKCTICPICRSGHGKLEISALPVAPNTNKKEGEGSGKSALDCFICHSQADRRCLDCYKPTCFNHAKHHQCGPEIDEDGGAAGSDVAHPCSKHPQDEVMQACRNCLAIFCLKCIDEDPEATCVIEGQPTTNKHIVISLQASGEIYRQILDEYLAQAQGLIENLRDDVKKIHIGIDEVEESGRSLIGWHKSQEEKISKFLELLRQAVNSRVTELEEKEDELVNISAEGVSLQNQKNNKIVSYQTGRLGEVISTVMLRKFKELSYPSKHADASFGDSVIKCFDDERRKVIKSTAALLRKVRGPRLFEWISDFDGNGIIHWFATHDKDGNMRAWSNPCDVVKVTTSSVSEGDGSFILNQTAAGDFHTCDTPGSWIAVDVGVNVLPTAYTLRNIQHDLQLHGNYFEYDPVQCDLNTALLNWTLEGSNEGTTWCSIQEHVEDQSLHQLGSSHTWKLANSAALKGGNIGWRHYRILMTGANLEGYHHLSLSGFEIYGAVTSYGDSDAMLMAVALKNFNQEYDHRVTRPKTSKNRRSRRKVPIL